MGLDAAVNLRCKRYLVDAPAHTVETVPIYEFPMQDQTPFETNGTATAIVREKVAGTVDVMASSKGVYYWMKPKGLGVGRPTAAMPMTGTDYWTRFLELVNRGLLSTNSFKVSALALCVDDRALVPIEKAQTQENRRKGSAVKPLYIPRDEEKNIVFKDGGLVMRGFSGVNKDTGELIPTPISPEVWRATSALRKPMFAYLIPKLATWKRNMCLDCDLYVDYDGLGYVSISNSNENNNGATENKHDSDFLVYGEADGKIISWTRYFAQRGYHVQNETRDSDIMAWSIPVVAEHKKKMNKTCIHWLTSVLVSKDKNGKDKYGPRVTNLVSAINYLKLSVKLSDRGMMMWTILNGTDFFDKMTVSKHIGEGHIIGAVRSSQSDWELIDQKETRHFHPEDIEKLCKECKKCGPLVSVDGFDMGELLVVAFECPSCKAALSSLIQTIRSLMSYISCLSYNNPRALKHKPTSKLALYNIAVRLHWHIAYWESNKELSLQILTRPPFIKNSQLPQVKRAREEKEEEEEEKKKTENEITNKRRTILRGASLSSILSSMNNPLIPIQLPSEAGLLVSSSP